MNLSDSQYRRALWGLVFLGAALRLIGLNWDEGRGLHPDEGNLVRAALALGVGGRWLPDFHAYNDLALWLPRVLSFPLCRPDDAACLTMVARGLSALLSVAAIPVAAGLARLLAGPEAGAWAGLAAAFAMATSAALIQWAHFGTTESALVLLVLLVWSIAAHWLAGHMTDRRMALLTAAALGLGFGMKTTVAVLAVMPLMAIFLKGRPDKARLVTLALGVLLTITLVLLSTPSLWMATADWLAVMRFENGVVTGRVPVFWTAQFHGAAHGWYELRQLWSLTSGFGLVLAAVGAALVVPESRRLALPGLVFFAVYAMITFGWHAKFFRYLAPLLPVLMVYVGVAAGRVLVPLRSRLVPSIAGAGLCLMALSGADLAAGYLRTDPRIAAGSALDEMALPGDVVAIEPHDLPQTAGRTAVILPLTDPAVTPATIAAALAGADWLQIASRRNWAVLPRQPGAPALICTYYAALARGDLGFVPVRRFDRAGPFGHLFAPDLTAEETRSVFDRPEVFVFRNVSRLSEADLTSRLSAEVPPHDCAAPVLQEKWRRGP